MMRYDHDNGGRPWRVHFSGIGGTAMVAGARLAIEAGWEVRGSDNPLYPPTSQMVGALDVPVADSYDARNLDWNPDIVVIGNALSRGNSEVESTLERGCHYTSLPEWLKEVILRQRRPVVVAGTHGKTTTTAITAFLLDRCGLNPGYLIGGQPLDFPHSARLGAPGGPFVIEGDEYDTAFFDKRAKFFHYLPAIAVVTSVEFDHADIYRDLEEIQRAFQLMLRQIPRSGWLFVCADDPGAAALAEHAHSRVRSYGFADTAAFRGQQVSAPEGFEGLEVVIDGKEWGSFQVPLAGLHNLRNTLAALCVAHSLGLQPGPLGDALKSFRGIRRRMEVFLEASGTVFVDDFAHHPTAIAETLKGARQRWAESRLVAVIEPRSNTMVTRCFQEALTEACSLADEVWLGPIHRAERIPQEERLDRDDVVRNLQQRGVTAHQSDDANTIVSAVTQRVRPGDVVLIMSNGAFDGIYKKFAEACGKAQSTTL